MKRVIVRLIFYGLTLVLLGCIGGQDVLQRSDVRNIPGELEIKLSAGDSREKVRHTLGDPIFDARHQGLELYRISGRDLDYIWGIALIFPVAFPMPGQKVVAYVFVAYDDQDLVNEIKANIWVPGYGNDYWTSVGGHSFVNSYYNEPGTVLAPPTSWKVLANNSERMNGCRLILLFGKCPMEAVSLDGSRIDDFSPAGRWCGVDTWQQRENNLNGSFLEKHIKPGSHRLDIRQKSIHGDFWASFTCEAGETIYAELEIIGTVPDVWHGVALDGVISIRKNATNNPLDTDTLRPILWHQGKWYGESSNPR